MSKTMTFCTGEAARQTNYAQLAMNSSSKPSVPSKKGQWLQEVAHHGNTSKLSPQGCSKQTSEKSNLTFSFALGMPSRLSSAREMVGGVIDKRKVKLDF